MTNDECWLSSIEQYVKTLRASDKDADPKYTSIMSNETETTNRFRTIPRYSFKHSRMSSHYYVM